MIVSLPGISETRQNGGQEDASEGQRRFMVIAQRQQMCCSISSRDDDMVVGVVIAITAVVCRKSCFDLGVQSDLFLELAVVESQAVLLVVERVDHIMARKIDDLAINTRRTENEPVTKRI
jgi:hypothetical protein